MSMLGVTIDYSEGEPISSKYTAWFVIR